MAQAVSELGEVALEIGEIEHRDGGGHGGVQGRGLTVLNGG
jgi:hypothetical protein